MWKRPFPGLGMATVLFAGYLAFDYMLDVGLKPLPSAPKANKYKFELDGDEGDTMPTGTKRGGGH